MEWWWRLWWRLYMIMRDVYDIDDDDGDDGDGWWWWWWWWCLMMMDVDGWWWMMIDGLVHLSWASVGFFKGSLSFLHWSCKNIFSNATSSCIIIKKTNQVHIT